MLVGPGQKRGGGGAVHHVERQRAGPQRTGRHGHTACGHVSIPDGLYFLYPVLFDNQVERLETHVDLVNQFGRGQPGRQIGEPFEIGEQHCDTVIMPGVRMARQL